MFLSSSEYVRRVGRTARGAAGGGLVSVLVLGRQVRLAKEIINRNAKGLPVHRVPPALPQAADGGAASALDAVREAVEDERRAERAEQKLGQGAAPVEEAEEGAEEDLEWGDEEE
jgi:superfamily II DNA/RNA helicase